MPTWAWALLFAIVLCLPRLGAFGLWEPWELNLADRARRMAEAGSLTDPTVGGTLHQAKALQPFFEALGVKLFGASEFGARIFDALLGIGALMAVYWAGLGLFRRRAALLAVLVLGSTPVFALSARQMTSDIAVIAALALALGGWGRFAWPAGGARRWRDAGVGLLGLLLGYAAAGALVGVVLPALAVVAALAICARLIVRPADGDGGPTDGTGPLCDPGIGRDVAADKPLMASTWRRGARGSWLFALLAIAGVGFLAATLSGMVAGKYSALLGGTPRSGPPTHTFEHLVRHLGFGLFPWSALAFFALGRPLIRLDDDGATRTNSRLAFGQTYLLLFAGLGLAASTYLGLVTGEARFVGLAAIGLAIGVFLDEVLEGNRLEPVAGLLIATGTMIVARDFFLEPDELVSVQLFGEKVKWPPAMNIGHVILLFGLVVAVGVYIALAARGRAVGKVAGRDMSAAPPWQQRLQPAVIAAGRWGVQAAIAVAIVFILWLTQFVVPALSKHFSFKPVMQTYARYAKHGERFGRYRVEGQGTAFYGGKAMTELTSQDQVIQFLRGPDRVFALVSADELAALDAALKQAQLPYYAVDASSSRFLLLSNRLSDGERDQNPLKKDVWMAPTNPGNTGQWNPSEHPPWTWRLNQAATFGDAIEIVGADFPATARRPGKVTLSLFFRVKARPPGAYKIFVHLDGPATPRVIGDHDPVGKAFPTGSWLPGEYIRDVYDIDIPLMTTPAGTYRVFIGFWPGGEGRRLKITQGPNDGADRLLLGTLEIK